MSSFAKSAMFVCLSMMFACGWAMAKTDADANKNDITSRQTDVVARLNLGTAISLILPVALIVALFSLFAPLFTGLFSTPSTPFLGSGHLGYGAKKRSLFSGVNQESLMHILESVTKAFESFSAPEKNSNAKPQ